MNNVATYLQLIQLALPIGQDLVDLIKDHANQNLTDEEWLALENAWRDDEARAKANAGL